MANARLKVAVIDDYQDAFRKLPSFARLSNHEVAIFNDTEKDAAKLAFRLKDADVVVLTQQRSPFPRELIQRLPNLKFISQTGRNVYHIDVAACAECGIAVSAGGSTDPAGATAELAWALIHASARNIPAEVQRMKEGGWQRSLGTGLSGRMLGVYAYGRVGSIVARVGHALGMRVLCWGRASSTELARQAGYEVAASRDAFFASADVVTLHLPLNEATCGIVTAQDLSLMKPTALLVNTSRAALIPPNALVEALKLGRPGYAAVDVYEEEPMIDRSHPLLAMPNVICTPHLGYVEQRVYEGIYATAVEQIIAFAAGSPINLATPA